MIRVLGVLVAVALYIYGIIDVLRSPREEVRSLPRAVWLLIVVLLPILAVLDTAALLTVVAPGGCRGGGCSPPTTIRPRCARSATAPGPSA